MPSNLDEIVELLSKLHDGAIRLECAKRGEEQAQRTRHYVDALFRSVKAMADLTSQTRGRFGLDALMEAALSCHTLHSQAVHNPKIEIHDLPVDHIKNAIAGGSGLAVEQIRQAIQALLGNEYEAAWGFAAGAFRQRAEDALRYDCLS